MKKRLITMAIILISIFSSFSSVTAVYAGPWGGGGPPPTTPPGGRSTIVELATTSSQCELQEPAHTTTESIISDTDISH